MLLASMLIPNAGPRIEAVTGFLWVFPISLAAILFLIGIRRGYALQGATISAIYLPPSFSEAIQYVREQQSRPWDNRGNPPSFPEESSEQGSEDQSSSQLEI